jgi:hypothetical protein
MVAIVERAREQWVFVLVIEVAGFMSARFG